MVDWTDRLNRWMYVWFEFLGRPRESPIRVAYGNSCLCKKDPVAKYEVCVSAE
jgi:hypothetical protein